MEGLTIQGNHVKAKARKRHVMMTQKPTLGRAQQSTLLVRSNALDRRAKTGGPPKPHFDKYKCLMFLHDQIELTDPKARIAIQHHQATRQQVPQGNLLGGPAPSLRQ